MNKNTAQAAMAFVILMVFCFSSYAQDRPRAQYPAFLSDAYYSVNIGYINYPFTNEQLEPPYEFADAITVPNTGVRLMLYGRNITDWLDAQISYMRPVLWVEYKDLNGNPSKNTVWMNVGGLTLLPKYKINDKFTVFGEFGLAVITRHGFSHLGEVAVKDANYGHLMYGAGINYHLNENWDLVFHGVYAPEVKKYDQPHTVFFSPGFRYNMKPLSEEKVERNMNSGIIFPKNQITLSYTSNAAGYGVNLLFSQLSIFWGGHLEVESGWSFSYQRNVFHGHKIFSLDFGASVSRWITRDQSEFYTAALYPIFRFTFLRTKPVDFWAFYSVAGPAYISTGNLDGVKLGEKFTFHDYVGIGAFAGQQRQYTAELKIGHYSNGNLFPDNQGVMVPLTLALGYNF